MKYQSLIDLIDPDVPSPATAVENAGHEKPDAQGDAYVIGEGGNTVHAPDARTNTGRRSGRKPWAKPAAFGLATLFVVLTIWNLNRLLEDPPAPPIPSAFQVKQALYLGVMRIDAYRRVHGVTPDSLADVGLGGATVYSYVRVDPFHYLLAFHGNGAQLEYDSIESKEGFFGSPQEILTMGGSK